MKKSSIFKKYIIICTSIITFSFLILGSIMTIFMSNYWNDNKTKEILKNMKNLEYIIQSNIEFKSDRLYVLNSHAVQGFIDTFTDSCEADVIISNTNGNIMLSSSKIPKRLSYFAIPPEIINEYIDEIHASNSNLGGLYSDNCLIAGYPIKLSVSGQQKTILIAFAVVHSNYIDNFLKDSTGMIVTILIIVLVISALSIAILNYHTLKPLKEMADITKSFAAEDFSKRVNINHNDEIGQLAIAFNNMAETLSLSEDVRKNFIANVSHELKTPITTISGFVDGIIDGIVPEEKQKHYLSIVSSEIKRLSRVVNCMLSVSRIDSGKINVKIQKVDIIHVITGVVLSFENILQDKNIEIVGLEDTYISQYIECDLDMIYQVFYNIIENATKFTPQNGKISFNYLNLDKVIDIKIRNTGQGISSEDIPFIFERFYKTDKSRSEDKNGMGLGLYIVKRIVALHNGQISVKSSYGNYCEFELILPIKNSLKEG